MSITRKLRRRRSRIPQALREDRHDLYQKSVQSPESDVDMAVRVYRSCFGAEPRVLREDFCGTALTSCAWAASSPDRVAVGVDHDPTVIEWGRRNNVLALPPDAAGRVMLWEMDVAHPCDVRSDVTLAQNYSYFCFKTRDALRGYFTSALASLADRGVLLLDIYGGPDAISEGPEERECDGFDYIWDQESVDPVTCGTVCRIHFAFPDGSRIDNAFSYDWRLWSIQEVRELLLEAGFDRADVWWDVAEDEDDEDYRIVETAGTQEGWLAYVAGVKLGGMVIT